MTNSMPQRIGPYEIEKILGQGGFGTVYLASNTVLKRKVALKVLRSDMANSPKSVKRFMREAQTLARLKHPNIVTVYMVESNPPYMALELVEGMTLGDHLQQNIMTEQEAIPILKQIAAALDMAHKAGLVHRDVKPVNVMITPDRHVKLLDFGIVKRTDTTNLTAPGVGLGSVPYMAPEQIDATRKHEIGPPTDIYALGVLAYQILTRRLPFEGNRATILAAHLHNQPPDPRTFNANISESVVKELMKALAKQPGDRYPTASAFVMALEQAILPPPNSDTVPVPVQQPPLLPNNVIMLALYILVGVLVLVAGLLVGLLIG